MYRLLFILNAILYLTGCNSDSVQSDAFGNFEAETVIVSAESGGKILELNLEKGQQVEAGFKAALIDTSQLYLNLLQTEAKKQSVNSQNETNRAQIDVLKEQKKNLRINLERVQKMLNDGAATQKQLDDIQGQINVTDKQIASANTRFNSILKELEVLEAQKLTILDQLDRCSVRSPVPGTILDTYAEKGEYIMPGKALCKIAEMAELTLKVYVSGAQLSDVKIGQNVEVLIDKTDTEKQTLAGKVTWISSEAEFTPKIIQTREERVKLVYAVKISVPNDGTLKIGMPGEANF